MEDDRTRAEIRVASNGYIVYRKGQAPVICTDLAGVMQELGQWFKPFAKPFETP